MDVDVGDDRQSCVAGVECARMQVDQPLWLQARKAIAETSSRAFPLALVRQAWIDSRGTDLRSVRQLELVEAKLAHRDQPRVPANALRLAKAMVAVGRLMLKSERNIYVPFAFDAAEAAAVGGLAATSSALWPSLKLELGLRRMMSPSLKPLRTS